MLSVLDKIAIILANIGAVNWGLSVLGWNAVEKLIGSWAGTVGSNVIYTLVALAGIWCFVLFFKRGE